LFIIRNPDFFFFLTFSCLELPPTVLHSQGALFLNTVLCLARPLKARARSEKMKKLKKREIYPHICWVAWTFLRALARVRLFLSVVLVCVHCVVL
jgi:hypothetical protein